LEEGIYGYKPFFSRTCLAAVFSGRFRLDPDDVNVHDLSTRAVAGSSMIVGPMKVFGPVMAGSLVSS